MNIKNVQEFRTNWRKTQGYDMPNWDENFIGSVHEENSGFYKMVNGIVDNIKADLTPKLQNAQDEQAIYEFLQNAADCQSTECAVIYDEDYFMVLNNGAPFSEKDLKALLNSFQGTKSDKTRSENCEKIGRYGIGFKLAYRLMGKSDGAEELLRDLAGPLVFSWHNNQQFNDLLNYTGGAVKGTDRIDSDLAPWLLKIILACFPTSPNEKVKDLNYEEQVLFQQEELVQLVEFLNSKKDLLANFSLQQGSLFFLKFGPKKHEKLKESLLNIKSGIGYAMNNLKTLERVALQDEIVEKYATTFERYSILPGTEDFNLIDPEFPGCPIEISLGFPSSMEQMLSLKSAPSLYQFFPMRNERHSMSYFIHSSSFAKITDRTRLDDQGEANIETFKYISRSLIRNLASYKQNDFESFVRIYQALILSDRSTEYDAELINTYLYDPLLQFIQTNIPTNKGNFYLKDLVVAKGTALPIEPMMLGIGKEWFYWTDIENENEVIRASANNAKLGLKRWGIKELIIEANLTLFNNWVVNLQDDDYEILVHELKKIEFDDALLERFMQIKCFKFTDTKGDSLFYALNDLQGKEDIFLMSEKTLPIRDVIKSLGFSVLEFNILDYSIILQQLEEQLDYLTNDLALYEKIAARTASAEMNPEQKHRLFDFMRHLEGVNKEQLRSISLFNNHHGKAAPLHGLLPADAEVEYWLDSFKISAEEDADVLQEFYIAEKNTWEIYSNIIVPFWSDLVSGLTTQSEDDLFTFYKSVQDYYNKRKGQPKLNGSSFIYTDKQTEFKTEEEVFYHKCLESFGDNYEDLRSALRKVLQLELPSQRLLSFYNSDPMKSATTTSSKEWKKMTILLFDNCREVTLDPFEKKALFQLLRQILPAKDLANVQLFSNSKGEKMVLSKLIASDNTVESWLDNYKIAIQEDDDILQAHLAKDTDIYTNIISVEWSQIIAIPTVTDDIRQFYQGVIKYARLSKSPKPLVAFPYVYINKEIGFISADNLFYHQQMEQFDSFTDLQSAIFSLTELHVPHKDVIPFLQYPSFKTRDSVLAKLMIKHPVILERSEARSVVQFFELTKEDIFTYLYITEGDNNRESIVGRRSKEIPYAVEKGQQKLGDKINAIFSDKYKLLPPKLYFPEFRNKGLLVGKELFNVISKSKDVSPDLLSALIMESGSSDVQEQVFSKIDKIVLKEGQTYDAESFEHQSLQIFRNKDADYSKVRSKIFVEDKNGELYKLTDIAYSAELTMNIERFGKFTLSLSEVLPRFKKLQVLLNTISNQLTDFEAPTLLKKRCFEGDEINQKEVFLELKKEHSLLDNSAQLAFALLFAKSQNDGKLIRNFMIHNIAGSQTEIGQYDAFHINKNEFIEPQAILDISQYGQLSELIKINDEKHSFEFGSQRIIDEPYFDKNIFYCSPMRTLQEGEDASNLQQKLFNFAYQKWSNLDDGNRPIDVTIISDDASSLAGVKTSEHVYPNSFALVKERLPNWLITWIANEKEVYEEVHIEDVKTIEVATDDGMESVEEKEVRILQVPKGKVSFLRSLGVHTEASTLVKIRQFFKQTDQEEITQKQLNSLLNNENELLQNTILWLQSEGTLIPSDDLRLFWLRKLYNTLPRISNNTPLPYIANIIGTLEEPIYEYLVANHSDNELFYFDAKQQTQLHQKYNINIKDVHDQFNQSGDRLTNLDIKGIELKTSKIENVLDVDQLKEKSAEWGADYYQKWKNESAYCIYLYNGMIPYKISFLGRVIKEYVKGNAVLHDKIAYVNANSKNIEEDLFTVTKYNALKEADLLNLLRYKNEGEEQVGGHTIIEKVIETVVVEEPISEDQEFFDNPSIDDLIDFKSANRKGKLKLDIDLSDLPDDMLKRLVEIADRSRVIVERSSSKSIDKS